jgi:hypothetical protein
VGEQEVLDCRMLDVDSKIDQTAHALDLRSSAVLDSFRLGL